MGAPRYPTPRGSLTITRIIWNRWWVPPPSEWAREEKVTRPDPDNPLNRVRLLLGTFCYLQRIAAERDRLSLRQATPHQTRAVGTVGYLCRGLPNDESRQASTAQRLSR